MELLVRIAPLRLRHRFTIAHGSTDLQHNLVVELRHRGKSGFGEASTVGYYGNSAAGMAANLFEHLAAIEAIEFDEPTLLHAQLAPRFAHDPFALCALDLAAHDLWGKLHDAPVHRLWGLSMRDLPPSDYTIGIASLPEMVGKLREFPHFPVYKIKLGTDDDLAIVRELRRHTSARFRVDANCAWSVATTLDLAPKLRDLGVEFLEQPLAAEDEGHAILRERCALPVIADESCQSESDVERCAGRFHGVNIKLTKCGGLTPARRMIDRARQLGLAVMVGCMTESTIGISAIAQLLPSIDYADMDGALLLAEDLAEGCRVGEDGRVEVPDSPGLGIRWTSTLEPLPRPH